MKIKSALLSVVVVLGLWMPMGMVTAQTPNTKEDNACYEGGSMAGKCDTEWEWVCGYYLARWESNGGWSTVNNPFNDACVSLLPPRPVSVAETIAALGPTCIYVTFVYVNFNGGFTLPAHAAVYLDSNCTIFVGSYNFPLVYAGSLAEALALCQSNFGLNSPFFTSTPNVFICQ